MPKQIQSPFDSIRLAKHYGIKGRLPLQLDEVVVPVHVLSRFSDADGEPCAGMVVSISPPLGEVVHIGLRNPSSSGILAELETVSVFASGVDVDATVRADFRNTLGTDTVEAGRVLDMRSETTRSGCTLVTQIQVGTFGGPRWAAIFAPNGVVQPKPYPLRAILPPGSTVWVHSVDDVAFGVNFRWTERPLSPSFL